jgi:hypothetical protein
MGRDLNQAPPHFEAAVLPTRLLCPAEFINSVINSRDETCRHVMRDCIRLAAKVDSHEQILDSWVRS